MSTCARIRLLDAIVADDRRPWEYREAARQERARIIQSEADALLALLKPAGTEPVSYCPDGYTHDPEYDRALGVA